MKRIVMMAVSVILALIVALPIAGAARQEPPFPVEQDFVL